MDAYSEGLIIPHKVDDVIVKSWPDAETILMSENATQDTERLTEYVLRISNGKKYQYGASYVSIHGAKISYPHTIPSPDIPPPHPSMSDSDLLKYIWPSSSLEQYYAGMLYLSIGDKHGNDEIVEIEDGLYGTIPSGMETWIPLLYWPIVVGSNRCNMAIIRSYMDDEEYGERARYILEDLTRCELSIPDGYHHISGRIKKMNTIDRLQMNIPYTLRISDTIAVGNIMAEIRSLDTDVGIETHSYLLSGRQGSKPTGTYNKDIYKFYNAILYVKLVDDGSLIDIYDLIALVGHAYGISVGDSTTMFTDTVIKYSNNDPDIMMVMSLTYREMSSLSTDKDIASFIRTYIDPNLSSLEKSSYLPHCHTFQSKVVMTAIIIIDLIRVLMKKQEVSDRKDFMFKRWDTSGHLKRDYLRSILQYRDDISSRSVIADVMVSTIRQNKWLTSYTPSRRRRNPSSKESAVVNDVPIYNNVSIIDALRMVKIDAENTGNTSATRRVHTSQYGYQCPANTPENENIGLNNALAEDTLVSVELTRDEKMVLEDIINDENMRGDDALLIYDGEPLFHVKRELYDELISHRDVGLISHMVSISIYKMWGSVTVINIRISYGRPLVPLLRLDKPIGEKDIHTWKEMLESGRVQHLDAMEVAKNVVIAPWIYEAIDRVEDDTLYFTTEYTHACIIPTTMLSQATNCISYVENDPGARGTYASTHIKQAIAHPFVYREDRWDHEDNDINNPEPPLSSTRTCRRLGMTNYTSPYIPDTENTRMYRGYGINARVLFSSDFGNYDDAIHISENLIKRGGLIGNHYDIFKSDENISVNNYYNVIVEKKKNMRGEMVFVEIRADNGIGLVDPDFSDSVIVPYQRLGLVDVKAEDLGGEIDVNDWRMDGMKVYEIDENLYMKYGVRYNLVYTYKDMDGTVFEKEYESIDDPVAIPSTQIIEKKRGQKVYSMALVGILSSKVGEYDQTFLSKDMVVIGDKRYVINRSDLPIPRVTRGVYNRRTNPFAGNIGRPVAIVKRREVKRGDIALKVLEKNINNVIVNVKKEKFSVTFGTILKISRGVNTRIAVAMPIKPEPGNKYAALHAQKGVCAKIIPSNETPKAVWHNPVTGEDEVMEFDIIFNSMGIPSRMTTGMEYEMYISGTLYYLKEKGYLDIYYNDPDGFDDIMNEEYGVENATALVDMLTDTTPFIYDNRDKKERCRQLRIAIGIPEDAMYDVVYEDGRKVQNKMFCGSVYYVALRHLVDNKRRARGYVGKRDPFTYQPVKGRRKDGGAAFGTQETDVLKAHGARALLWERMNKVSDGRTILICKICGGLVSRSGGTYKCIQHNGDVAPSEVYEANSVQSWQLFRHAVRPLGLDITEYYEEIEEKKHTSSISRPQTSNSVMKASAEFKLLNSYVSKSSYISTSLRLNDIQGYSAAGILVIDNGIYDLIKESRNGVIALSIPGGKRDSISETPSQTALREYKEEGGKYDLSPSDLTTVLWYAPGHYALYIVVKGKRPTSLSLPQSQLHKFTYDILTTYFDLS